MTVAMDKFPYKLMLKRGCWWWWNGSECCTANVTSKNDTSFLKAAGSHPTQPTQSWNADSLMESTVQQIFTLYNAIQLSNQFFIL